MTIASSNDLLAMISMIGYDWLAVTGDDRLCMNGV